MGSDFRRDYDGSVFLNARSIHDPISTLIQPASKQRITATELAEVLSFVETCALSKDLHFDPTIPSAAVDRVEASLGKVQVELGKSAIRVVPMNTPTLEVTHDRSLRSFAVAQNQLSALCQEPTGKLVNQSLSRAGGLKPFRVRTIARILAKRRLASQAEQESLSLEVIETPNLLGGKFLAGVVHPSGDEFFELLDERVSSLSVDWSAKFLSACINTFRAHLISKWAESERTAYQPPEYVFWDATKRYSQLAWDQIKSQLPSGIDSESVAEEGFVGDLHLPPIGLLSLMQVQPGEHPVAILAHAIEIMGMPAGKSFRKLLWDETCYPTEDRNELRAAEQKALALYSSLSESAAPIGSWRSLLTPGELETLIGTTVAASTVWAGLESEPKALIPTFIGIPFLGWRIWKIAREQTGQRGYVNFWARMSEVLNRIDKVKLEAKVEHVFRCRLDWSN